MPMKVIKRCADELSPSIAMLANRCLQEGKFPDSWKEAVVSPIPKEDNSSNPADYRPISLLPLVSKLVEKHMYDVLYPIIDQHLSKAQFGFRKKRSTTEALALFQKRTIPATRPTTVRFLSFLLSANWLKSTSTMFCTQSSTNIYRKLSSDSERRDRQPKL